MGYSINTSGYWIWDPTTHRVWDVRSLDFDGTVTGGWWRKPAAVDKPAWGGDEPLHFDYVEDPPVDPPVEQPGAIVQVPATADDDDDGDGPRADVPDGGAGGGLLDDVDEDDDNLPAIEGAPAPGPRMSQRERRGVPPLHLIETMMAADESDNGGAPATCGIDILVMSIVTRCNASFTVALSDRRIDH